GEVLLTPSLIYTPLIASLRKAGHEIKGISHITGGGLGDNFGRVLKVSGYGAELNDIYHPLSLMLAVQEVGKVSEEQAYRLWNMGNGMLLVVPAEEAEAIIKYASKLQYEAKICGTIIEKAEITIDTKGLDPQRLSYKVES
ncbi:MAG: AIR synthase-related protein, partial [Candidatus Marinimicrobia bacterium]|nr:AIR synthase-related protein [Candidatus Neomarinimicrobiota bacterium]